MKRIAAAACLCAAAVSAPGSAPVSAHEPGAEGKAAFERDVREYLLANPDTVIKALQVYKARQDLVARARAGAALEDLAEDVKSDPMLPKAGAADGDVTLVEFFDYNCGFCKRAFADVQELIKTDGNIRYVLKEFPVLGPESEAAGKFMLAVWMNEPERYAELRNTLMQMRGRVTMAKVRAAAAAAGVDAARAESAMDSPEIAAALERTYEQAEALGIDGTPSFVIGGEIVSGARDLETLRAITAAVRAGG